VEFIVITLINHYYSVVRQRRSIFVTICVFLLVASVIFAVWWLQQRVSAPFLSKLTALSVENISLPDGFAIGYYARSVKGARSLAVSSSGIVYVGTRGEGAVYAVLPNETFTEAQEVITVAQELNSPNGVAWHDGDLYVAENNRIIVFEDIDSNFSKNPEYKIVRNDLPQQSNHGWKYLSIGPDNKLYVPIGAPCNVCESTNHLHASLTRMDFDGNNWEVIASGIRNTVGFDWHPITEELWFTDNGRDWLGDDAPGDELNRIMMAGGHYGFPYCHNMDILDPEFGSGWDCSVYIAPEQVLGPHVAALGMHFYTGEQFPGEYKNTIFIAEHGSWNRSVPIGYRVTTVSFDQTGTPQYTVFADGWLHDDKVSGRPVDVLQLHDGSLLVSDDHAGAIYRIWYSATIDEEITD